MGGFSFFFLCQTPQNLIFDEDGKLVAGRMWAQMEIPKSKLIGGWKVQGSPNTRTLRGKPRNKRDNMTGGKTANLVNETNDVKPNTCQRKKNHQN